jgi:DNA-binding SARP family transcriptional activator
LEIRLLGLFRVAVDEEALEEGRWSRRKPALLVKLLALQPHHQIHREQAMELLWPGSDPEPASNNLHKLIHRARHALEPGLATAASSHFILTQGRKILLRAPGRLWVDVKEFEQRAQIALKSSKVEPYAEALAIYEGDLLAEDLYEDWIAERRERLRAQYCQLLASLASLHERRGEPLSSIERLKELVASDSTNEEAHRELMRLYALTGNKHQALRQYQLCVEALQKDLDAEPEPETCKLREQIVSGSLAPREAAAAGPGTIYGAAINSLAILPLVNTSADADAEYFSDGITESIINSLSQLPRLRVMARSTVFRYKGQDIDPQEVGGRLGVRAVLTGRVLHREGTFNIQTELVDATDGSQLWGEQYSRSSTDIFEVQEEIAKEITGKLRLKLTGEEKGRLAKRHTENAEAYQLYLKGSYFWNKRTMEAVKKSIEYFRRAIEIDKHYALAYTGLSNSYAKLGDVGFTAIPPRQAFARSKAAALKALEIDEEMAEAHTSLAHVHMHDYEWSSAGKEFRRALKLNPNYPMAHHWYAYYLIMTGQPDESLIEIEKALELDPLSLPIHTDFGELLYLTRQYDRAVEQIHQTLEMDPYYYQAHLVLARIYDQQQMYEESISEFLKAHEIAADNTRALASLGHAYAAWGKKKEAREILTRIDELSKVKYVSPYVVATVYVGLDEPDRAFEWLNIAYEEHAEWIIYLTIDPRLDPLRSDRRYREIVRRIGLDEART